MAQTIHNISTPNDGLGDELRTAFDHQNEMNTELYTTKVDKITGKGLSTNDYDNAAVTKLAGIEAGAQVNVKSDWNATSGDAEILNKPDQLFASVGFFDYNDLATQTTPLTLTANVPYKVTNDTLGSFTDVSQAPYGVSTIWDSSTNSFDFTSLSIGDTIDLRIDLEATTIGANENIKMFFKIGVGTPSEYNLPFYDKTFKTAAAQNILAYTGIYIGSEVYRDNPTELYIVGDSGGSVKVNGWYTRVIRKDINVISFLNDDTKLDKDILDYDAVPLPLVDSDKLLVNRVGNWYKVDKSELDKQIYKTISANTTLDNTYHNAVIWVTANCNITIPSGLRSDFNCTFRTFTGVTASFLTSGTIINSESDGNIQAESSMVLIATYSTNNFILSGGGLS